jgi:phosphatidylserine/phosphatidylglycerophosphate/cardiolipin synthase-like enzyme
LATGAVAAAVVVAATSAASGSGGHDRAAARARPAAARSAAPARPAAQAAATYYRLVQYPEAGFGGFYQQIAGARHTIDMEMYELQDPLAQRDLIAAAARGVRVRVLLDKDFSGGTVNRAAADELSAHGVQVRWAPAGYIFHIKATSFDSRVSDISTANLVSKYYRTTRDAEIVDTDSSQVRGIERTFANDWSAGPAGKPREQTVQAPGLVWSPNTGSGTAQTALVRQIRAARSSIDFESEELADPVIYGALAADARRGRRCRVVMTRSAEWYPALRAISRAGCHVRLFADSATALYIHEKLILDDGGTSHASMLIGSQNASVTSLTRNRELGVLVKGGHGAGAVIATARATFDTDFGNASPWPAPAPKPTTTTSTTRTTATTTAGCYPLSSSGHCYEPGEYCSSADHGLHGVDGQGDAIVCGDNDGSRWKRA